MDTDQEISGEELYRRFQSGDTDAFECLVAKYENELAQFIHRIVNDCYEAKHLTIETFARLAVNGRPFEGNSSLKTYLFAIGKNLSLQYLKLRKREQHISFEEAIESLVDRNEKPDRFLEREENARILREAMGGLLNDYRAVLILLYFEDMSYIQAGRVMKKSVKQIKNLSCRAKAALKRKLESNGFSCEKQ